MSSKSNINWSFCLISDNSPSQKYFWFLLSFFLFLKKISFPVFFDKRKHFVSESEKLEAKLLWPCFAIYCPSCLFLTNGYPTEQIISSAVFWLLKSKKSSWGKVIQQHVSFSSKCNSFLHLKCWSQIHICKWYWERSEETKLRHAVPFCLYFLCDICIYIMRKYIIGHKLF